MATPEELRTHVTTCLGRALAHLTRDAESVPDDLEGQLKLWQRTKGERGRKAMAGDLGLHEAELPLVDAALRDVERTDEAADDGDVGARNATLARMRLLGWFETIGNRTPALALDQAVEEDVSEDLGRKQVRAVELVVRSLITESYGDQEALVARLRDGLNERVVEKWQASADPGDILSGCSFSELASLFVNKDEFERYEKLYDDTPFLTLLKQRRRTVQSFLDDIRRIRNVLAHNKRISPIQLSLLDLYYEELITPVQDAHDHGETKVDPEDHLDASKEDIERFVSGIHEDVQEVRDDLAELRADVMASLGEVEAATARIETTTKGIDKKLIAVGGGVLAVIVLVLVLINMGGETQDTVEETQETAKRTEEATKETAKVVKETAEATKEIADATKDVAKKAEETADASKEAAEATKEAAKDIAETKDEVAKGTAEMKKAADATKEAADASKEAAEASKDAAKKLEDTGEKIVQTLEELRSGFAALTQAGGIIPNPRRPQEHYHNARMYEQRSDYAKAMESYKAFFGFEELEFIDPHLRFQTFLKLQRGVAGAREVYYELKKNTSNVAMELAWILLLQDEARTKAMDAFLEANPTYAPAYYERSRDFSVARLGSQAIGDKRQEKGFLSRFLELKEGEEFLRYYLDQTVAAAQIQDAEERMKPLEAISDEVLMNPVTITGNKTADGWNLGFRIADWPREILYRIGKQGEFKSTGYYGEHAQVQGNKTPKMQIVLKNLDKPTVIEVKYRDQKNQIHGPFAVDWDPKVRQIQYTRGILDMTSAHWVLLKSTDANRTLLYFSHLLTYRSSLKEIRYGLDKDVPDKSWPIPPDDPKNPGAITPDVKIYRTVPNGTRYVSVQLVFLDDSKTEIKRFDKK